MSRLVSRLGVWLELTRPGNAIAAGVLTFTGAFVAGGVLNAPVEVVAAVAATVAATGGGNAINDYFDREIDAVNQPNRPIPREAISPQGALRLSIILFVIATIAALTLPLVAIAIAVFNLVALIAYTELFKGLPGVGNVLVGYLTGSAFLFGAAAVGDLRGATALFVLAAVATLTREIIKDVEDIDGDRAAGLRTLPIVGGEHLAVWIGVVVMLMAVAASSVPYLDGTFGVSYLSVVIPANAIMLGATLWGFREPTTSQRWIKRGMLLACGAFIIGRTVSLVA